MSDKLHGEVRGMGKKNGHGNADLAPAGDQLAESDYLVENEAEAWGFDLRNASHTHQKVWTEQERFLSAFRAGGTIKAGLANVKVCRRTVELWKEHDLLRFRERFLAAHETFCDTQEEIIYTINKGLKPGHNVTSALATLNANRPLKWRPTIKVAVDVPNELIQQLRALQALGNQENRDKALPAPKVVDGKAEVLPWE
ncbi:MAG: hypothetical protein J4N84_14605 [Chloroflexi bacterium]|nr:hypothetical protein [Chloroflexota bacterium]MCI0896123.1 hypothetical protein [Chloroflexota bacterium]